MIFITDVFKHFLSFSFFFACHLSSSTIYQDAQVPMIFGNRSVLLSFFTSPVRREDIFSFFAAFRVRCAVRSHFARVPADRCRLPRKCACACVHVNESFKRSAVPYYYGKEVAVEDALKSHVFMIDEVKDIVWFHLPTIITERR